MTSPGFPATRWIVEDTASHGFNVLFGPPRSGKTFVALSIACCVASGTPWFGKQVNAGTVVYLAGEGGGGLLKRIRAWDQETGRTVPPKALLTVRMAANLLDPEDRAKANRTLSSVKSVRLIVVDNPETGGRKRWLMAEPSDRMSREEIIGALEDLAREGRGIARLHALKTLLALPEHAAEEERGEVQAAFEELDAWRYGQARQ